MKQKPLWIAVVKEADKVLFRSICQSKYSAENRIVSYLRKRKQFEGRHFDQACFWIGEKELGLELLVFSMQPEDFREVWNRLAIFRTDLPLKEKGLYRVIYEIDVGSSSAIKAAQTAHEMMSSLDSLPPVLDVIDSKGNRIRIDLSQCRKKRKRLC